MCVVQQDGAMVERGDVPRLKFRNYALRDKKHIEHDAIEAAHPPEQAPAPEPVADEAEKVQFCMAVHACMAAVRPVGSCRATRLLFVHANTCMFARYSQSDWKDKDSRSWGHRAAV